MDELRERLRQTRRVAIPWSEDKTRGVGGSRLDALLNYCAPRLGGRLRRHFADKLSAREIGRLSAVLQRF